MTLCRTVVCSHWLVADRWGHSWESCAPCLSVLLASTLIHFHHTNSIKLGPAAGHRARRLAAPLGSSILLPHPAPREVARDPAIRPCPANKTKRRDLR